MKIWNPLSWFGSGWRTISGGGNVIQTPSSTPTESGETVTAKSLLQISTAWACCRLISQTISTLPIKLYKKENGRRVEVSDDIGRILNYPNPYMSGISFMECIGMSMTTWGNSYSRKNRIGDRIVSLTPMLPEYVQIKIKNGEMSFIYTEDGKESELKYDDVLHVPGLSLDGYVGLSPIQFMSKAAGMAIAGDRAAATTFKNGMRLNGVMKMPNFMKSDQRDLFRERITNSLAGALNANKFLILEGGMEFQALTMHPEDAQLLESRKFQIEEICRWYGVPPFMIGHTEKSTSWGTGIEQQNLAFLTYTLLPYLEKIESAANRTLLTPEQRSKDIYFKFNVEGLLRADSAGRAEYLTKMVNNGLMTRNEARHKEELEPVPGADSLTVQSNLLPIELLGKNIGNGVTNAT